MEFLCFEQGWLAEVLEQCAGGGRALELSQSQLTIQKD